MRRCRGGERLRVSEEVQVIVGVFEVRVGEDGRELEKKRKRVRRNRESHDCDDDAAATRNLEMFVFSSLLQRKNERNQNLNWIMVVRIARLDWIN